MRRWGKDDDRYVRLLMAAVKEKYEKYNKMSLKKKLGYRLSMVVDSMHY